MCTVAVYTERISVYLWHRSSVTGTVSFYWYYCWRRQNAASQHHSYGWQHGSVG